jgi:hypothetical protein
MFYGFRSQLTPKGKTRRGITKKLRGEYITREDKKIKNGFLNDFTYTTLYTIMQTCNVVMSKKISTYQIKF